MSQSFEMARHLHLLYFLQVLSFHVKQMEKKEKTRKLWVDDVYLSIQNDKYLYTNDP